MPENVKTVSIDYLQQALPGLDDLMQNNNFPPNLRLAVAVKVRGIENRIKDAKKAVEAMLEGYPKTDDGNLSPEDQTKFLSEQFEFLTKATVEVNFPIIPLRLVPDLNGKSMFFLLPLLDFEKEEEEGAKK